MNSLPIVGTGNRQPQGRYDERMVAPMREELVRLGFLETRTAAEVDRHIAGTPGSVFVVVNSVCGCAAGRARPGVALALRQTAARPDRMITVFAGNDVEATERARSYLRGYAPSSPQMALLEDGQVVFMLERRDIEGRDAPEIAADIVAAFERIHDE